MNWKKLSSYLKETWNFIWNEDSIWSWMLNILIAFVLIKFIIYPGIGVLLGTNLPIVAVISESMEHDGNFEEWWNSPALCDKNTTNINDMFGNNVYSCRQRDWYEQNGITKEEFLEYPMKNGFNKGDIIILKGVDYDSLEIGEILVYQAKLSYPVIHRVTAKGDVIETKGDHNQKQVLDSRLNEKYITKDQMLGKAWIRIPYIGYVKILFSQTVTCITFNGCRFG